MANELTTLYLFRQYAGTPADTARDALLTRLISDVSALIGEACNRAFGIATYRTWLDGTGSEGLRLPQWPVVTVYQACISADSALAVTYTGGGEYADVSFDGATLTLHSVDTSGTEATTELAVATHKTVGTLAAAIAAVTGWSGEAESGMENYPSAVLRPDSSGDVLSPSEFTLSVPIDPVESVHIRRDSNRLLVSDSLADWPEGHRNVFVWFRAGYTLPADDAEHESLAVAGNLPGGLTHTANRAVHDAWNATRLDGNTAVESLGGHTYTMSAVRSAVQRHWHDLAKYAEKWA
jgi:hypothetical protein